MFDYVVVGAGLAGCVMAERIAKVLNKNVLILEKRDHIGGNCYDYYNKEGILVQKYGPHILHTELKHVWEYLSAFTDWDEYQHKVLGFIDGNKIPIPFNLNSLHETFPVIEGQQLEEKLLNKYGYGVKISISDLQRSDDIELRPLVSYVYNKVFLNYTIKQWGIEPEKLDPSVISRVPVLLSRDDHYFQDHYQGLPRDGYFKMFERMISSPQIKIKLNTDYKEILEFQDGVIKFLGEKFNGKLIFTGEIDYFFDYEFGKLPYRSLNFEMETLDQEFFQEVATINYPNDYQFTRITEFKHLTGQKHPKTTIAREYPQNYNPEKGDIPYYPIPKSRFIEVYRKYKEKADKFENLIVVGRLAEYQYLNMDRVIDRALTLFKEKLSDGK